MVCLINEGLVYAQHFFVRTREFMRRLLALCSDCEGADMTPTAILSPGLDFGVPGDDSKSLVHYRCLHVCCKSRGWEEYGVWGCMCSEVVEGILAFGSLYACCRLFCSSCKHALCKHV